jgi:hypothetical protein
MEALRKIGVGGPPLNSPFFLKKSYLHLQILIKSIFPLSIMKRGISNPDITKFFVFFSLDCIVLCDIFGITILCDIPCFSVEGGKSNFDIVELTVPHATSAWAKAFYKSLIHP